MRTVKTILIVPVDLAGHGAKALAMTPAVAILLDPNSKVEAVGQCPTCNVLRLGHFSCSTHRTRIATAALLLKSDEVALDLESGVRLNGDEGVQAAKGSGQRNPSDEDTTAAGQRRVADAPLSSSRV